MSVAKATTATARVESARDVAMLESPFATSVFHPTDFSDASEQAFAHALAIAVLSRARLEILHAGSSLIEDWERFPAVRRTLERWGLLPDNSERGEVYKRLGVSIKKREPSGDPSRACVRAIREIGPDVVVLATEGRSGVARWLRPSIAEAIANRSHASTLFVPMHCRGIVSLQDGAISLERILIPVADRPSADFAMARAEQLARTCEQEQVVLTALRVNGPMPGFPTHTIPGVTWSGESVEGNVIEAILSAADSADLIVMPTEGTHGVWDALRGSTTAQILRAAPCPVLAVPAR